MNMEILGTEIIYRNCLLRWQTIIKNKINKLREARIEPGSLELESDAMPTWPQETMWTLIILINIMFLLSKLNYNILYFIYNNVVQ